CFENWPRGLEILFPAIPSQRGVERPLLLCQGSALRSDERTNRNLDNAGVPPGTFVQIDPKQTHVRKVWGAKKGLTQSPYARPIYFLDIRSGYAFGWCQIENGVLTLIPHPDSGEPTRT